MTPEEIARGLTKAGVQALRDARMNDHIGPRLICNRLYPPTIAALERRGLVDTHCHLTALGLAVRAILMETNNAD